MDSISTRILLGSAGAGEEDYWIATLHGSSNEFGEDVAVDSAGNSYIVATSSSVSGGANHVLIVKYDTSGVIQWQRTLGSGNGNLGSKIAIDSSSNVYVITNDSYKGVVAKYNSNGAIQWQRKFTTTSNVFLTGVAVDGSGNVYVGGYTSQSSAGANDFITVKYNGSGTILWQRRLGSFSQEYLRDITADSSGNVYAMGMTGSAGLGGNDILLAKYNSTGVLLWQKSLGSSVNEDGQAIQVDNSGNVYVFGEMLSGQHYLIFKFNSNGVLQWQRNVSDASIPFYLRHGAVDSSGNAYAAGWIYNNASSTFRGLIVKYNSSGTVQWQRTLTAPNIEIRGITAGDNQSIYVTGLVYFGGSYRMVTAKLPDDGSTGSSGTGTYAYFTYAASSFTTGTPTLSSGSLSFSAGINSLTDAAASLTNAAISLTSFTFDL